MITVVCILLFFILAIVDLFFLMFLELADLMIETIRKLRRRRKDKYEEVVFDFNYGSDYCCDAGSSDDGGEEHCEIERDDQPRGPADCGSGGTEMTEMIEVWLKEPDEAPIRRFIPNTLEFMQWYVCGDVEKIKLKSGIVIICNVKRKTQELMYNCTICGQEFAGKMIFAGQNGKDFDDCPAGYMEMRKRFPGLWEGVEE